MDIQNLLIVILDQNQDCINWYELSAKVLLPESIMRRYAKHIDWDTIALSQKFLTENFIREFQEELCWVDIFLHQTHLSEKFVREFHHKVDDKRFIIEYQKNLSDEFIEELKKY